VRNAYDEDCSDYEGRVKTRGMFFFSLQNFRVQRRVRDPWADLCEVRTTSTHISYSYNPLTVIYRKITDDDDDDEFIYLHSLVDWFLNRSRRYFSLAFFETSVQYIAAAVIIIIRVGTHMYKNKYAFAWM
jgi:hypothetical protein